MKALAHSIEVEATIAFSARELQLLHHFFSYSTEHLKGITSSYYAGGVTTKELEEFQSKVRAETAKMMKHIQSTKEILFQNP